MHESPGRCKSPACLGIGTRFTSRKQSPGESGGAREMGGVQRPAGLVHGFAGTADDVGWTY
ncbi:MAG TPA: hypothetical protein VN231_11675, partial [Allosphingosinicella sp.]|nr:hypothetical protein [Allosphingosinicella sp.]